MSYDPDYEEETTEQGLPVTNAPLERIASPGKMDIELDGWCLDRIVDVAASRVADRVWTANEKYLSQLTKVAMDKIVAERMEPLIVSIVGGSIDEKLKASIEKACTEFATKPVKTDGRSAGPYDKDSISYLEYVVRNTVFKHFTEQAVSAVADIKENARKIATGLLAQSIQAQLPKLISN